MGDHDEGTYKPSVLKVNKIPLSFGEGVQLLCEMERMFVCLYTLEEKLMIQIIMKAAEAADRRDRERRQSSVEGMATAVPLEGNGVNVRP